MSTSTSRLVLTKPDPGEVQDITVLNGNADKVDLNIGLRVCTSGTRPATPYQGQTCYETDTKNTIMWSGTEWLGVWTDVPFASGFATVSASTKMRVQRRWDSNLVEFRTARIKKITADLTVVAGTLYTVGTVPSGFRPNDVVSGSGVLRLNSGVPNAYAEWVVLVTGEVQFRSSAAGTWSTATGTDTGLPLLVWET